MATINESDTKKNMSSEKANTTPAYSVNNAVVKPPMISLILIVALVAMGFAIYAMYSNAQLRQQLANQQAAISSELEQISEGHTSAKDNFDSSLKTLDETQGQLAAKINTIDKNMRTALEQQLYHTNDWMLLKARYYLQIAQINAYWSDNLQTTEILLEQADALLSNLHDQRLFEVRQAIAQEISQIKSISHIDMAGILSKLDAISNEALKLPVKKDVLPEQENSNTKDPERTPAAWRERLKNSVNLLERLVIIRRHDEGIQPLLSAEQETMLRETIRLNIQEAQLAVLQRNEEVYKLALNQAIQNVQKHFKTDAAPTKVLLSQLEEMKKINLNQTKPDLKRSLTLLNQLIESKNPKSVEPATTGENS